MEWQGNENISRGSFLGGHVPSHDSASSRAYLSGDPLGLIPLYLDYDAEAENEEDDDLYFR
jgi:hypothetical protein